MYAGESRVGVGVVGFMRYGKLAVYVFNVFFEALAKYTNQGMAA